MKISILAEFKFEEGPVKVYMGRLGLALKDTGYGVGVSGYHFHQDSYCVWIRGYRLWGDGGLGSRGWTPDSQRLRGY